MGAPCFPRRTVEDVAVDLIEAADQLALARTETSRIAAALEARWAANRVRPADSSGSARLQDPACRRQSRPASASAISAIAR